MSRYLEEAAELLRKSADAVERRYANSSYATVGNEDRERIAKAFATLAAIDNGLLPAEITQDVIAAVVARATA